MTRKNLNIKQDTYDKLDASRAEGQSFDGKINELLKKTGEATQKATP